MRRFGILAAVCLALLLLFAPQRIVLAEESATAENTAAEETAKAFAAPVLTKVTVSGADTATVMWNAVTGCSKYCVYYKESGASDWTIFGKTGSTAMKVSGLSTGKTYQFTVGCMTADGKQTAGAYDAEGLTLTFLPSPVLSSASLAPNGVKLAWTAVEGAGAYRVYYRPVGGSWKVAGDTAETSYLVDVITSGKKYEFTVRCMDADCRSFTSYFKSVRRCFYVEAPQITSCTITAKGFYLDWTEPAGATYYTVYWRRESETGWHFYKNYNDYECGPITDTPAKSEALIPYLSRWKNGDRIIFTVRATVFYIENYEIGIEQHDSTIYQNDKAITYYRTPVLNRIYVKGSRTILSWGSGGANFAVYYRLKGTSKWIRCAMTTVQHYDIVPEQLGLVKGKSYYFTVRVVSANGKQYYSGFNTSGLRYDYK